jgi:DNA-binding NarL/FixJ family response regulator
VTLKIRVAIFDDNPNRRDGLHVLIDAMETMECVGMYNDCRDIIRNIEHSKPDVVLMDINMPYVDGVEGVKAIRTRFPKLKILMQTVFEDDEKIFSAIYAGADGYLLKQAHPMKLIDAISEVIDGGAPMTPSVAKKVLQFFGKTATKNTSEGFQLTKRELEILAFLVQGSSYKMIAERCAISYNTVNSHISKIYEKLHVSSATEAVTLALREGLVK